MVERYATGYMFLIVNDPNDKRTNYRLYTTVNGAVRAAERVKL